jgi:hypothetical protein
MKNSRTMMKAIRNTELTTHARIMDRGTLVFTFLTSSPVNCSVLESSRWYSEKLTHM